MDVYDAGKALTLFNMEFLSSVTAMILAVNLITQVIKEIFLSEKVNPKIPKIITLVGSIVVVSAYHYRLWIKSPVIFDNSMIELVFLIFLNSIFIAALSMGNYKVLNLTKDKEVRMMKEKMIINEEKLKENNKERYEEKEEFGELF